MWEWANSNLMGTGVSWFVILITVWSAVWKGLALWHAARKTNKVWFIIFLVVNTAGILEIIYLAFIAKIFSSISPPHKSSRK